MRLALVFMIRHVTLEQMTSIIKIQEARTIWAGG